MRTGGGLGVGVRFRVGGLGESRQRGRGELGRSSLWSGEEVFREREGGDLGGYSSLRIS